MRVNIYSEELTDRVELVQKTNDEGTFTGVRFYLYLPATDPQDGRQVKAPFMHRPGDDDSAAVTFWGKAYLYHGLRKALAMLARLNDIPRQTDSDGNFKPIPQSILDEINSMAEPAPLTDADQKLLQFGKGEPVKEDVALDIGGGLSIQGNSEAIQRIRLALVLVESLQNPKFADWYKKWKHAEGGFVSRWRPELEREAAAILEDYCGMLEGCSQLVSNAPTYAELEKQIEVLKSQRDAMKQRLVEAEEIFDDENGLRWRSSGDPVGQIAGPDSA